VNDPVGCEEDQYTLGVADLKRCEILIDQFHCDTLIADAVLVVAMIADSDMTTLHAHADHEEPGKWRYCRRISTCRAQASVRLARSGRRN
jgi:hypothetical protein